MISNRKKKQLAVLFLLLTGAEAAFAQGGVTGLNAGTTELKKYIDPVTNIAMAIGGITGIVGGIRIYQKWNSGDNDISKELMGWGGSCVFLIVAPLVIRGFFNL